MKRLLYLIIILILLSPGIIFAVDQKDIQVALTISGEAIGEGRLGMYLVACVIQNRAKISHLSPSEVVKHGFYGLHNKVARKGYIAERDWLLSLVSQLNKLELQDYTNGALFFESIHYPKNIAKFDKKYERCYQYKHHIFYKERSGK
jgi:spore germination cell wall hydrolase CwlJ-like protein